MPIAVDIADRLYDYSDEEKAAEAIAEFQAETGLTDEAVIAMWDGPRSVSRDELERRVFEAVDSNGSAKRASQNVPSGLTLQAC